jgi:hypothetical protein
MIESSQRVEQFKADIADMRLRDPATNRERQFVRVGVGLLAVGVGMAIVAYLMSHNTDIALEQRDAIIVALIGVAMTVAGGTLFLRYSLAMFLRFWLARLIYEQQAQTDRLLGTAVPSAPATSSGAGDLQVGGSLASAVHDDVAPADVAGER